MNITFKRNGILEINDARIIYRNFEGRGDKYNREGDRNFALLIQDEDIKDKLINDFNKHGVSWNVKIKPPREDGDMPFMYLPVKVKFTDRSPNCYLQSGSNLTRLTEENVGCLDDIEIQSVDLDIRPYDDVVNGRPFRAAYLQAIKVTQNIDRFAAAHYGNE